MRTTILVSAHGAVVLTSEQYLARAESWERECRLAVALEVNWLHGMSEEQRLNERDVNLEMAVRSEHGHSIYDA